MLLAPVVLLCSCGGPPAATTQLHGAPAGEGFQPFVFVHAGDPQIGGLSVSRPAERFAQLARRVNELNPAFVVVVGDLVNGRANPRQWAAFDRAFKEFRVPVKAVPGNHDDLAAFVGRFGQVPHSFTHNNCQFVCIDSNLFAGLLPSKARQAQADAQWQWLEATLSQAQAHKRTHIFLVMHHPPALLPGPARKRLVGLIERHEVQAVLCGHIHMTRQWAHDRWWAYSVAGTGWRADRKGFGCRVFRVFADRIEQEYLRL